MSLDLREVETVLYKTIVDMALVPAVNVAFPNNNVDDETYPRIEIERPSVLHPVLDLRAATEYETGVLAVIFVEQKQTGSKDAMTKAATLRSSLPPGSSVSLTSGFIHFPQFLQIRQGYEDYGSWRLPTELSYEAVAE
jgi:hypothetical protein